MLQGSLSPSLRSKPHDTKPYAFVACIEEGRLEAQALLLFESIRRYTGAFSNSEIFALSPRKGIGISQQARTRLRELQVHYIDKVLNTECPEYGSANRVVAAAYVAAMNAHDVLVVLDSDTLFLREPREFDLPDDIDVAVRPVDTHGICSEGPHDPRDLYWRRLCDTFQVRYDDIPFVESSVDRKRLKASYNGGLVVAKPSSGILQAWNEIFVSSIRNGILPYSHGQPFRAGAGWVSSETSKLWGTNQAALSLAIWRTTTGVRTLPATYNFPLHYHNEIPAHEAARLVQHLVHVHYHWLFDEEFINTNPLLVGQKALTHEQRRWLAPRAYQGCDNTQRPIGAMRELQSCIQGQ
jgi:hypothetical protein